MGIKATSILSMFFKRRDEVAGEVFSTAEAVALINEAQGELDGLKLLRKEADLTWVADSPTLSMPTDFLALATDRAFLDNEPYLWLPYKGDRTAEGLYLVPGNEARIYPAPAAAATFRFAYYHEATDIVDDPNSEEVMDGLMAPGLLKFFVYRMMAAAAIVDEDDARCKLMDERGDKVLSELVLWRHMTYGTDTTDWIPDPYLAAHDAYVDTY